MKTYICFVLLEYLLLIIYLVISYTIHTGSSPNKSKDSTDWQLIGGLIGGGVVLLLILAVMVMIFRPRQQPH